MERGIVGRIEDWEQQPFSGGFAGLSGLAEREFSGVIGSGGRHLFMLNGRVVGVSEGELDAFESASGTAYRAPHPGLPLLFAMQERGGDPRARYFTDDTPLEEVHETLSSGSFTGYVELAENVHSGDYYVVYYGGRALTVAFVGGTGRLLTDEEAFEAASDEVGIYEVYDVDLDVRDVPEPDTSAAAGATGSAGPAETTDEGPASPTGGEPEPEADQADAAPPTDPTPRATDDTATGAPGEANEGSESGGPSGPETADTAQSAGEERVPETRHPDESDVSGKRESDAPREQKSGARGETTTRDSATPPREAERSEPERDDTTPREGEENDTAGSGEPSERGSEDPFSEEQAWRKTRAVPALDPEETELPREKPADTPTREATEGPEASPEPPAGEREASGTRSGGEPEPAEPAEDQPADAGTERAGGNEERIRELEAELSDLRERLESVVAERDELREERDRLERQLREAERGAAPDERSMTPSEALDGTDLLVRYGSKGKPTLESAHDDGGVTPEQVETNLRLETHTRFDASNVVVDGNPYEAFVTDTLEYRFAAWALQALLFEIRETDNEKALRDLYDALVEIDRVGFDAAITTRDDEGEERREAFDVVFRDQMGKPVAVANLNDDRDPATGDMMVDLIESANGVVEGHDSLSAAFLVTASFFEPDALETAEEATQSGLLDRDSRKSFVKTSRKRGYHLCLVEAHGEEFRVAVPDL